MENFKATFDRATNTLLTTSDTGFSERDNYDSVGDFIDEVAVIPPIDLQRSAFVIGSDGSTETATLQYDSQKRVIQTVYSITTISTGVIVTDVNASWDNSRRPTLTTSTSNSGSTKTYRFTYDDSARRMVQTEASDQTDCETIFSAIGEPASVTCRQAGALIETLTYATSSTQTVCR